MRPVIVSTFVTLDGVMEAPGGEPTHPHTNWVSDFHGDELLQYKFREAADAGSLLLGRTTWESLSGAWPGYKGEFADVMNAMPKHVVSTTLHDPGWNTTVLDGGVPDGVRALRDGEGGPMLVVGSSTLVHALLEHDFVDELRLQLFPVSIGSGLRAFPDERVKRTWTLAEHVTFPKGVVALTYRPAPAA